MEVKPSITAASIADVLGLGAALSMPHQIDPSAKPYLTLPQGWSVHDLSPFLPTPKRPTGTLALGSADAFIRYVNKHKDRPGSASQAALGLAQSGEPSTPDPDDTQTVILVDVIKSKFRAIFDHHASDAPGWVGFGATYDCPLSPQWQTWTANDGRRNAKDQEEFAFFLEQNILDVNEPVGATMLEIVTTLKSTKNVAFDSGLRLQDGQVQLKYHEEGKATAGVQGQLQIPEQIKLGIPVYVGGPAYAVLAQFRYRIEGTKLFFWYDLVTPQRILEDSLNKVIGQIEAGTGLKTYAVTTLGS